MRNQTEHKSTYWGEKRSGLTVEIVVQIVSSICSKDKSVLRRRSIRSMRRSPLVLGLAGTNLSSPRCVAIQKLWQPPEPSILVINLGSHSSCHTIQAVQNLVGKVVEGRRWEFWLSATVFFLWKRRCLKGIFFFLPLLFCSAWYKADFTIPQSFFLHVPQSF